jgi:hypothetical protein
MTETLKVNEVKYVGEAGDNCGECDLVEECVMLADRRCESKNLVWKKDENNNDLSDLEIGDIFGQSSLAGLWLSIQAIVFQHRLHAKIDTLMIQKEEFVALILTHLRFLNRQKVLMQSLSHVNLKRVIGFSYLIRSAQT